MATNAFDHLFKVLLIGDAGVGKSSLLLRFTDDAFDDALESTVGVDFKVKMVTADAGQRVKLTLWDTAGQERFRTLTSSYYRGAQGVILVYDVTRRETFDGLRKWLDEVDVHATGGGDVVKLLVGNKIDREAVVPRAEAERWARREGMLFVEASAKSAVGVQQAFDEVVNKILDNPVLLAASTPGRTRVDLRSARAAEGGGCCA